MFSSSSWGRSSRSRDLPAGPLVGHLGEQRVDLRPREDRKRARRHPLAQTRDEEAVARDDDVRSDLDVRPDGQGNTLDAVLDRQVLEDELDRLVVAVQPQGELGLLAGDPVEALEEVVGVSHPSFVAEMALRFRLCRTQGRQLTLPVRVSVFWMRIVPPELVAP